jgi:hypothetical protein
MVMRKEKKNDNKSEKNVSESTNTSNPTKKGKEILEEILEEKPLSMMTEKERQIAEAANFSAFWLTSYFSRYSSIESPEEMKEDKMRVEEDMEREEFKKRWEILPSKDQKEISWLMKKAESVSLNAYRWAINIILKSPYSALKREEAREELIESIKEHVAYWHDDAKLFEATKRKAEKLKALYPDQKEKIDAIVMLVKKISEKQKNDDTLVVRTFIQAISAAYDGFSRLIISRYADEDDKEKKSTSDELDNYINIFKYWDMDIVILDDEALEMLSRLFPKDKDKLQS